MNLDQHTIYVSYADADEEWVVHFVNGLKVYLRKQLGKIDDNFIWAKFVPIGFGNKQEILQRHLKASEYLLVVMSPAYLKTIGNSEINLFDEMNNLILVEHDRVNLSEKLQPCSIYKFWYENERGEICQLSNIYEDENGRTRKLEVATDTDNRYCRLLAKMARDITSVKHLNDSLPQDQPRIDPPVGEVPNVTPSQKNFRVFIHATERDRALAIEVQKQLGTEIKTALLPSKSVKLTVTEREEYLKQNLLDCHAVIIVCGSATLKWTYMQVQNTFKAQDDRRTGRTGSKSDFSVIAIFNKPPPDDLEQELGLQAPNLRIWDCADIVNECIPKFKRIAFS